jgi:hypothetical protein
MQTIQELANRFYPEQDHSSVTYNKRLFEQVKEIVEYHVVEALRIASENAETDFLLGNPYDPTSGYEIVNKDSILNSYPLENIK